MQHELKTWTEYYQKIKSGEKTFEVRNNDRNFQVGDILLLKEVTPEGYSDVNPNEYVVKYTGNETEVKVTYVFNAKPGFGLFGNYCIMSIALISEGNRSAAREILIRHNSDNGCMTVDTAVDAMEEYATAKLEAYKLTQKLC